MLTTFLDKLSGFFDQQFIVAYWMPGLIGLVLTGGLVVARVGLAAVGLWWDAQTATEQWLLGLATLLIVSIIAYLLHALTTPLVRLYEGYWPRWLNGLKQWLVSSQQRTHQQADTEQRSRYYNYPRNKTLLLPTHFGNTLRAAEEYPYTLYQMDAIIWWPRLVTLLPDALRTQVDGAFTPVVALLNLCTLFGLWAVGGGVSVALTDHRRWLFGLVLGGGLALAWVCYRAAITQAEDYGDLIRVAFDLHRHALLEKLHMSVPDNLAAERILWYKLGQLHYYRIFPWDLALSASDTALPDDPFYYDTHKTASPAPDPKPQALDVNVKGLSTVILRRTGGL